MPNALRYHLRKYGLLGIAFRHPRLFARLTGGPMHSCGTAQRAAWTGLIRFIDTDNEVIRHAHRSFAPE